jgi:hypothetical protein
MSATMAKSGCGCGGGGSPSAGKSSCSCGGSSAICQGEAFTRPLFFSGQLLTEDDLRALVDYAVGKNRLHNRMLFGEGVVCGLLVTCDPCDCGKVIVQPGYALDCCGNDIVVECPVTLDVNKMVHELRTRMLGADCGDPCADKKGGTTVKAPSQTPVGDTSSDQPSRPREEKRAQEYCLYIRYCEKPVEPVAPYATDDCSPSSCQNTRLKEGYSFELRCREDDVEGPALWKRICECFHSRRGDEKRPGIIPSDVAILDDTLERISKAREEALSADPVKEREGDDSKVVEGLKELQTRSRAPAELPSLVQLLIDVAGAAARLSLSGDTPTGQALSVAAAQLVGSVNADAMSKLATVYVKGTASYLGEYFSRQTQPRGEGTGADSTPPFAKLPPLEAKMVALAAPFVAPVLTEVQQTVAFLYDRQLSSAAQPARIRCTLNRELATVGSFSLPELVLNQEAFARLTNGYRVVQLFKQDQLDCACTAINPSCPTCDDQSVLLACLKVRECCVEEICNLERDFVLTGPNARYWLPIDLIPEVLEWVCCPEDCDDRRRQEFLRKTREVLPQVCVGLRTIEEAVADERMRKMGSQLQTLLSVPSLRSATEMGAELEGTRQEVNRLRQAHEHLQKTFEQTVDELRRAVAKSAGKK